MAVERTWLAVAPQALTTNGNAQGVVNISNTAGFKVKQSVVLSATGLPDLQVQVKRVVSPGQLIVGPIPASLQPPQRQEGAQLLSRRIDISAYTVAAGAFIYAGEQPKSQLKPEDIIVAVYEQEPTVALRTTGVDQYGNFYSPTNPLPVALEGTISLGTVTVQGSPSGFDLNVNADGSINVNVVETPISGQTVKSIYNEITNVASGVQTQITFYTVPPSYTAILQRAVVSGDNFARYDVFLNGAPFDTKRTWYSDFNAGFEYTTGTNAGFVLNSGDTISIKVLHSRPFVGTFDGRIQVLEII
jgi:hypothetical protein